MSKYKVVFMPAFNLIKDEMQAKLEKYVSEGGNLVVTFRSGSRNWENAMRTDTLPGAFREMSGVEVDEFDSLNHGREIKLNGVMGEGTAKIWCDILKSNSAEILATYGSAFYQESPAVMVNRYGSGKVYYIGCGLDEDSMDKLVALITETAGIPPVLPWKIHGIEVVQKEKNGKFYWMILNHNGYAVSVELEGSYTELLTGSKVSGMITLTPYGVTVLA